MHERWGTAGRGRSAWSPCPDCSGGRYAARGPGIKKYFGGCVYIPGYRSYGRPPGLTGDAGGERTALCALVLSRGPENRLASAYKSCRNSSGEMRASFKILVSNLG